MAVVEAAPIPCEAPTVAGARTRSTRVRCGTHWWAIALAIVGVSAVLALLPSRGSIPPLVESDYCYQLIAADRLHAGLGPTSLQPVAPLQPWAWHYDWGWLTQWPLGYPVLICLVRLVTGMASLEACRWISTVACATALVGWFAWARRAWPVGPSGILLATVAAGTSVSTSLLINPSSDVLLVAVLPLLLLAVTDVLARTDIREKGRGGHRSLLHLALLGLVGGGLVWIRYAAVFVPLGIGLYLVFACAVQRRIRAWQVTTYGLATAVPIMALVLVNRLFGAGSVQSQFNLGHTMTLDFSLDLIRAAWRSFTTFGFYNHHPLSGYFFTAWPLVLIAFACSFRASRRALRAYFATPAVALSASVALALFAVLILATALFGDKFNFTALPRYYRPIKPVYLVMFVAPLFVACCPRRMPDVDRSLGQATGHLRHRTTMKLIRWGAMLALVMAGHWLIRYEWPRPYKRWLAAERPATPYGRWSRSFEPNAKTLYTWIREQASPALVIVSNYHEYVTLETGVPALPIPKDQATLDRWISRICRARGVERPQVFFVLDPDNRWRDYWIAPPDEIRRTFALTELPTAPTGLGGQVYIYPQGAAGS